MLAEDSLHVLDHLAGGALAGGRGVVDDVDHAVARGGGLVPAAGPGAEVGDDALLVGRVDRGGLLRARRAARVGVAGAEHDPRGEGVGGQEQEGEEDHLEAEHLGGWWWFVVVVGGNVDGFAREVCSFGC